MRVTGLKLTFRLRELQDRTGGFNCFIPLKFRNKDNDMAHLAASPQAPDMMSAPPDDAERP